MNEVEGNRWRRLGTSLIWDADALHEAATEGATVSLREALGWTEAMPAQPPGDARTVVVSFVDKARRPIGVERVPEAWLRRADPHVCLGDS